MTPKATQELDLTPIVVVASLLLAELICFGINIPKIGFYLDDWCMLSSLHFGPQAFWPKLCSYIVDPRVIIRPVEGPYFILLTALFGTKSLWYHILNSTFEFVSAVFLYLALARFTKNHAISLTASLLFLIYPTHDATHYWITASSINLSLVLSLASLWQTIKGAQEQRSSCLWVGIACFALGIFNYESFMPWFVLNIACAWAFLPKQNRIRTIIPIICAYVLSIATLWIYRAKFIPFVFDIRWYNTVSIDPANMLKAVTEGIRVNASPYAISFFSDRISDAVRVGLRPISILCLTVLSLVVCASIYYLVRHKDPSPPSPTRTALSCILLGIAAACLSLVFYGITKGYIPTLLTILNRINLGTSLGASLAISGMILAVSQIGKKDHLSMNPLITCLILIPLLNFFVLADWGLSQPWQLSWQTQRNIQQLLKIHAKQFHDGDSIIMINCPRYVQWAPVYDGVWDFQNTLQLLFNNQKIKGNVASERLVFTDHSIKDFAGGCFCGEYPSNQLFVLVPQAQEFVTVNSPQAFIQLVAEKGMKFGLDPSALSRWKRESTISHSKMVTHAD